MAASLTSTIVGLLQDQPRLQQMSAAMAALARPQAAQQIAELLRDLASRSANRAVRSEA
jgi:UDP-N-acetylglucosamine:LPS N-acetylglucosamine transferase